MHNKISLGRKEPSLKEKKKKKNNGGGADKHSKIISNDFIVK